MLLEAARVDAVNVALNAAARLLAPDLGHQEFVAGGGKSPLGGTGRPGKYGRHGVDVDGTVRYPGELELSLDDAFAVLHEQRFDGLAEHVH